MTESQTTTCVRLHSGRTDLETIVFERRSVRGCKDQSVISP